MLDRFEFIVEPTLYAGQHGGEEKLLRITATVNGKPYSVTRYMGHHTPWRTELAYYALRAVRTLEDAMIKEQENED